MWKTKDLPLWKCSSLTGNDINKIEILQSQSFSYTNYCQDITQEIHVSGPNDDSSLIHGANKLETCRYISVWI